MSVRNPLFVATVLALGVTLTGCPEPTDPTPDAGTDAGTGAVQADKAKSTIVVTPSGDVQANGESTYNIAITLKHRTGNPLSGFTVKLTSTAEGVVLGQPAVTDANGVTRGSVASTSIGAKSVKVISVAADGSELELASPELTFVTPAPTALVFEQQPVNGIAGAVLAPVRVKMVDAQGKTVVGATTSVSLQLADLSGGGVLTGTTTVESVNGIATFRDLVVQKAGTGLQLQASALTYNVASATFDIVPAATSRFEITAPATVTAGAGFGFQVKAFDALGNLATNYLGTVQVGSSDAAASVDGATYRFTAADQGIHTFPGGTMTLFTGGGQQITVGELGSPLVTGSTSIQVTANAAAGIEVVGQPGDAAPGVTMQTVRVDFVDSFGNSGARLTEEVTVVATLTGGTAGAVLGGTTTLVAGVGIAAVEFETLTVDREGTNFQLRFTTGGKYAPVSTESFSVIAPNFCAGVIVDDGNACTVDSCDPATGAVSNVAVVVDDGVACTVDTCDPATGLPVNTPDDGVCSSTPGSVCEPTTGCTTPLTLRAPVAGDLVITEVMHTPSAAQGRYFEVHNVSEDHLDLAGITVENAAGASTAFTVPTGAPVALQAGDYFVFGQSLNAALNGGVTVDLAWSGAFTLSSAETIKLSLGGTELESVTWDLAFPQAVGKAMNLSSVTFHNSANLNAWYWCESTNELATGTFGTPGAANGNCGVEPAPVTWCNEGWPTSASWATLNTAVPVRQDAYNQFFAAGVTNKRLFGPDFYPNLEIQIGQGRGADGATWTMTAAQINPGFNSVDNNDESMGYLEFSEPGTYTYGFRYRLLDPVTQVPTEWAYCDGAGNGPVSTTGTPAWHSVTVTHAQPGVRISELQTAGSGGAGDEFIELHNSSASPVDIGNWKLQYRAATGATYANTFVFPEGASIAAYGYVLLTSPTASYKGAVAGDYVKTSDLSLSGTAGHVRLALPAAGTAIADTNVVDTVGFGTTANGPEGSGPAPAPASGKSIERKAHVNATAATMAVGLQDAGKGNGHDSNDNAFDFVVRDLPQPQSRTSAIEKP